MNGRPACCTGTTAGVYFIYQYATKKDAPPAAVEQNKAAAAVWLQQNSVQINRDLALASGPTCARASVSDRVALRLELSYEPAYDSALRGLNQWLSADLCAEVSWRRLVLRPFAQVRATSTSAFFPRAGITLLFE